jgi:hypothetical protein
MTAVEWPCANARPKEGCEGPLNKKAVTSLDGRNWGRLQTALNMERENRALGTLRRAGGHRGERRAAKGKDEVD